MDNGHSFDSILFYGNEQLLFQIEILLFICIIIISGNCLFAILFLGIASQVNIILVQFYQTKTNVILFHFFPFADIKAYNAYAYKEESIKSNINRRTIFNLMLQHYDTFYHFEIVILFENRYKNCEN